MLTQESATAPELVLYDAKLHYLFVRDPQGWLRLGREDPRYAAVDTATAEPLTQGEWVSDTDNTLWYYDGEWLQRVALDPKRCDLREFRELLCQVLRTAHAFGNLSYKHTHALVDEVYLEGRGDPEQEFSKLLKQFKRISHTIPQPV